MAYASLTGLAQYSGDPKTEWHLNAHATRDSLMEAVANLPYKGGNTMTGTEPLHKCFIFYSLEDELLFVHLNSWKQHLKVLCVIYAHLVAIAKHDSLLPIISIGELIFKDNL